LLLICLGLLVAVVMIKKQAGDQHHEDVQRIDSLSNQWTKAEGALEEQKQVATMLQKDMDTQKKTFEKSLDDLTNNFTQVSSNLAKSEATLRTTEQELKERDAKISELEASNQSLEKDAKELEAKIASLNTQIDDTRHKLAASEGDKAFLQKELQRMMAEKTELERQFNDLSVVRAQLAKLKEQMNVARRLEWARLGLLANTDQKGAQKLMQGVAAPASHTAARPNYDLNVEVNADGSVKVIPPLTNQPPANTPTGK
jgi:chromosome segregation ATPase